MKMGSKRQEVLLLLLPGEEPPGYVKDLENRFPGLKAKWHQAMPGDRLLPMEELPSDLFDGITLLCTFLHFPDPERVPGLKLVQLCSAGTERAVESALFTKPEVEFCSANGCHS